MRNITNFYVLNVQRSIFQADLGLKRHTIISGVTEYLIKDKMKPTLHLALVLCIFELLNKISELKTHFNVEKFYNVVVVVLIGGILWVASSALKRPVSPAQYQYVVQLTQQYSYPDTQRYAEHLSQAETLDLRTYFKLLHLYQMESKANYHLPAQNVEMK